MLYVLVILCIGYEKRSRSSLNINLISKIEFEKSLSFSKVNYLA